MRRHAVGLLMAATAVIPAALAQQLRDPTRPPSFMATASGAYAVPESGLVLQTVLISPERRAVIINGRLLHLGEGIAGLKVAEIRESEVLLKGGGEARTLLLYPAVEKRAQGVTEPGPADDPTTKKKNAASTPKG
ncbi:MAG TPA: hypothetical protein VFB20_16000 [Burkholderiales bacterium]|nr:hypothetical protein [Burkholderiales bacterium]